MTVNKISTATFHSLRSTSAGLSGLIRAGGPFDDMRAPFSGATFRRFRMASD